MKNISLLGLIVLSICSLGMTGAVNPQPDTVIVPNVEGVTIEVAAKMLQTMGLQPLFRSSAGPSAIVVWQDPRPGVSLSVGGEVGLSTGTLPQTTTTTTGTRTLQSMPTVSPQPGTPGRNTGLKVSTPRFYPAWYPRKFLTSANPPTASSVAQSESMRITVQPTVPQQIPVSPYVAPNAAPQVYPEWYPHVFVTPEGSQSQVAVSQPYAQQRVGVLAISTTPVVPIPYLVRLYQEDAITAITKAGLAIGHIIRVQSAQVGTGIVMRQSPQPRALVPAGTAVDLWVAY